MSDANDNVTALDPDRKLAEAMRAVKNAAADRDDVVVDMRDAERMRLELLVNELAPIIAQVPHEIDIFDFAISSGLQPRFWVDGVSHVAMGRDKRSYRFVRDTRDGRVVLAESSNVRPVADAVTRYIAERIVDRERMLDGGILASYRAKSSQNDGSNPQQVELRQASVAQPATDPVKSEGQAALTRPFYADGDSPAGWKAVLWSVSIFLLGGLFGFAIMATQWWVQISQRVSGQ